MANGNGTIQIFSTTPGLHLAHKICERLSLKLGDALVGRHNDDEVRVRIQQNVRGTDVFIIAPLHPPAENFFEAIWLSSAARSSSAARVTVVIPYFGYARDDRKAAPRTPIGAQLALRMIDLIARPDRIILLDIHAEQTLAVVERAIVDHLFGSAVLVPFLQENLKAKNITIGSPDAGGTARARQYAKFLSGGKFVIASKERSSDGVVDEDSIVIIGDVKGKTVVFVDDIIDTAGTLISAAKAVRNAGAKRVFASVTHALFSKDALRRLAESEFDTIYVMDSIYHDPDKLAEQCPKVKVLSADRLLAEAIRRTHDDESLSKLIL